ncbi:MAG TPA: carbohydrate binding domain-containing protein, partial [Candidatus Methylacidiphilales bacterium]
MNRVLGFLLVALLVGTLPSRAENLGPEMLVNGSLAEGKLGWSLDVIEGASADLTLVEKGCGEKPALSVAIHPSTSEKLYTVQLTQKELALKKGQTYRLTFQAKSDPGTWFFVTLAGASAPYAQLTKGAQVQAGTDWKPFSFDLV